MKKNHFEKAMRLLEVAKTLNEKAQKELALYRAELESTPVVNVESEELPAPPAEVILVEMLPKHRVIKIRKRIRTRKMYEFMSHEEELMQNIPVMQEFPVEYTGKASFIGLHLALFDNKQEHPFMDRNHVMIDVYDEEGNRLNKKNCYIRKDNLVKYNFLVKKGLYQFTKKGDNWFEPKTVYLSVD